MQVYEDYLTRKIVLGNMCMSMMFVMVGFMIFVLITYKAPKWGYVFLLMPGFFLVFIPCYIAPFVEDKQQMDFVVYVGEYDLEVKNGPRAPYDYCYLDDDTKLEVDYGTGTYTREDLEEGAEFLVYTRRSQRVVDAGKMEDFPDFLELP
ncbi:MAG: hypothetical protein IJX13_04715 [Clostridia bacterium]|nr:hypothetical protein [Clostridia bacterium]